MAALGLVAAFPIVRAVATTSAASPPPLGEPDSRNTDVLNAGVRSAGADESWWQEVSAQITNAEYEPKATAAGLQAPNRTQNLRTTFAAGGIEIEPRTTKEVAPAWRFFWETSGIGREGSMQGVNAVSPVSAGDRVTYHHEGWSEWYVNTPAGLEQGFTLECRPKGEGQLRIVGKVPAELKPEVREDGAIDFLESDGARAIRYGELHVWDATGAELPSEIAMTGTELALVIDDRDAQYPLFVDPLMSSPAWTDESNQVSAHFGISVSTAGDVNGDGFSDVIVGAYDFDNGTISEGKAFVYHGSASGLSLTANWSYEGNLFGAWFGYSVATAGDVNGDGFDDVIVGAPYVSSGEANEGAAFAFYGSSSGLSPTANWTAEGNQASATFGYSVSTAGDVNGDGLSDVIVGAAYYDNGQTDEGRVFVYYGSVGGLSVSPSWIAESDVVSGFFGQPVANAGDVNGDGFDDVIVAARVFTNGQANEGKVFVYHGSASGLTLGWVQEGNIILANFGTSIASAGDVNGDGYGDVLVGAPTISNSHTREGRAYAFFGSPSGLGNSATWTAEGNASEARFGYSVATAGDVNGDGFGDIIVGAYGQEDGGIEGGGAFVYLGAASGLAAVPSWTGEGGQVEANYGLSVATAGDVNGDGFSEVIVGAHFFDNGETDEGKAFVYYGSGDGLATTSAWTRLGLQFGANFGSSVASAGDVNGDGYSDVIVSEPGFDGGYVDEGRVYVFHGAAAGLATTPAWQTSSFQLESDFGVSANTAGDVNGDGYSDIVIGAPGWDSDVEADVGRVYIYYGSAAGIVSFPALMIDGDQLSSRFGGPVGTAGDVNGDGFSDVIVGAPYYNNGQQNEGRAYVYLGSATGLIASPAWIKEVNQADCWFGSAVATAGDVNGDGFSDVVVGAMLYDHGEVGEGRAYVFHGSATGLNITNSWIGESDLANAYFGSSVGTAGDVNGDGFSDVVVGAYGYAPEGKAFAYHGSASGLNLSPEWSVVGDVNSGFFGTPVKAAGDVNGDGFSDVIVGDRNYTNGQTNEGRVRVFHGSNLGLNTTAFWTVESNVVDLALGSSAGTAGDVNGDGFSDVIVGGPGVTDGPSAGRAFVYYGNGGDGLNRIARQARSDDAGLVSLLGTSDSPSAFQLKTLGRTVAGRGGVRLQAEIKPLGVAFNGSGFVTGPEFDTGAPSGGQSAIPLSELVSGLSANTLYHWRLRTATDSPFFPHSPWFSQVGNAPNEADIRTAGTTVAVADPIDAATHVWLAPSAPNPFTEETRVAYTLPDRGHVRLAVFDVAGRRVAVLADEVQNAGQHSQTWDARESRGARLSAGVYFVRLEFGGRVESRNMVLTR